MMDMGQQLYNDAGAGGALPPSSSNSNSLQFSPQSALTGNENLFLLDTDFSPYSTDPSIEPFNIPLFSAQMGGDFSSVFMDHYSANAQINNNFMEGIHQASPGSLVSCNGGFYAPADEWSGTSTNSMQEGGQGNLSNITSANSQLHTSLSDSSFITGNNQSMALDERSPSQQLPYNDGSPSGQGGVGFYPSSINRAFNQLGSDHTMSVGQQHSSFSQEGSSILVSQVVNPSQVGSSLLGSQPSQGGSSLIASQGVNSAGVAGLRRVNCSQGEPSLMASQGVNQNQGASLQRVNSNQGASCLLTQARNHELQNPEHLPEGNADFPPAFFNQQQSHTDQVTISNVIANNNTSSDLHETSILSYPPEATRVSTLGFEPRTHTEQGAILGNSRAAMMQSILRDHQQGSSTMKSSTLYQGGQGDASNLASYQEANSLFQPGMIESSAAKLSDSNQVGQLNNVQIQQNDVQQPLRRSSFQLQGGVLQSQSPAKLESISQGQGQTHGRRQGENQNQNQCKGQIQSQDQGQEQVQSAYPQVASPNQRSARYQSRQLPGVVLNANQKTHLHSIQPLGYPNPNPNLHLNGMQQPMMLQMPRFLNPVLQGLKVLPPQRSVSGFNSDINGNARTQMPPPIAARCIQVIMQYIQEQQKKPPDNDISFWRNLFKEFFVPDATKRWCLSSYNSSPMGRHAQGLFPMDHWFCNICGVYPGRGFESSTDVLPRLFKIKYASGLLNELLFLDMPEERYMLPNGRLVLEFPRVVHESIFPELRVVRYGRLRVTLLSSFKIYSWEFCTKIHEEVVSTKSLFQQAQQLAKLVLDSDQEGLDKSVGNLKAHCHDVTATVKQLEGKLEAPTVNDLGFSKRYVRCLQIAEVVNSMKDLISFEKKTGLGPLASLSNFPTVRKLSGELLVRSTLNQTMNQLTQGNMNLNNQRQGLINEAHQHKYQPQHQHQSQSTITTNDVIPDLKVEQSNGVLNQKQSFGQQIQSFGHQMQNSQTLVQPVNFNHIAHQMYDSAAGNRQLLFHPTQSYQTGSQSLPGTPQSEMSDIRTNA